MRGVRRYERSEYEWNKLKANVERKREEGWSVERLAAHYMVSFVAMRAQLDKWGIGMKLDKATLAERNEKIIKLVKGGLPDMEVVKRLTPEYPGMGRGVVIGIRHRNGLVKSKQEMAHANRQNGKKTGMGSNLRRKLKTRPMIVPTEPRIDAAPIVEGAPPAPIGDRWIPIEKLFERTGCAWVEGDVREKTAVVCNAPRCRVKYPGVPGAERTPYCAEHWKKRRSSAFTKVVA